MQIAKNKIQMGTFPEKTYFTLRPVRSMHKLLFPAFKKLQICREYTEKKLSVEIRDKF